jgi:hypothetical protein
MATIGSVVLPLLRGGACPLCGAAVIVLFRDAYRTVTRGCELVLRHPPGATGRKPGRPMPLSTPRPHSCPSPGSLAPPVPCDRLLCSVACIRVNAHHVRLSSCFIQPGHMRGPVQATLCKSVRMRAPRELYAYSTSDPWLRATCATEAARYENCLGTTA